MRRTLALVAATAAVLTAPTAAMAVNGPETATEAAGETEPCAMGLAWSALLIAGFVGEPTPQAALEAFLAWPEEARTLTLPAWEPRLVGAANTARFVWTDDAGNVVATVGMAHNDSGYAVNGGSACADG